MSHYIPLATKYRPQRFADVVGQDISIRIIKNGIMKNRLGAAMLFSGTRGIGKTSIARIVAKAIRCENNSPEPCEKCNSCLEFNKNNTVDVLEIDAASNTSVEDIREIIESARYMPTTGRFKIFIIDEVHMLSKSAFNALLKTLEEPPAHVVFLLATTETQKVPDTILSRVLRFDLQKISIDLLKQYLLSICNQENVMVDEQSLSLIAKTADGSLRDSLSILDQAINLSDNNIISLDLLKEMLLISDESDLLELFSFIVAADLKKAIEKYRDIIKSNFSCNKIAVCILKYIHISSCLKSGTPIKNEEIDDAYLNKLKKIAEMTSISSLSRMWQMLIRGLEEIKLTDNSSIVLEMMIIRIVYAASIPSIDELLKSVDNLSENKSSLNISSKTEELVDKKESTSLSAEAEKMFFDLKK